MEFNTNDFSIANENIYDGRIRIYDGDNWHKFYYDNTSLDVLKKEAMRLRSRYKVINNKNILKHKKLLGAENVVLNKFSYDNYKEISATKKILYLEALKKTILSTFELYYKDIYIEKTFITEDIYRKYNISAYGVAVKTNDKENSNFYTKTYYSFEDLENSKCDIINYCNMITEREKYSVKLKRGRYRIILAPSVTGILVHECFGHIFEADVRYDNDVGDRLTCNENLCICDDGNILELGYCPFDDEGIININTDIIKKGFINGYLADLNTALKTGLCPRGNGRCVMLKQDPISRMTNTYMMPTNLSRNKIFDSFNGIYVLTASYGEVNENGDLIIKPSICRVIQNGLLKNYVNINKLKMGIDDVFSSIHLIGDDLEFSSSLFGGCGKLDQYPLLVSQGGPHILINDVSCL